MVKTAESPRGKEQNPTYILVPDTQIESQCYLGYHAWNFLTAFLSGPAGQALHSSYGIAPGVYGGYFPKDLSQATQGPSTWIDTQVNAGTLPKGDGFIYVLMSSAEHAGSGFNTQWGGYHGASDAYPYLWVPYDEADSQYLDSFTQILGHEYCECTTDTWPGNGVVLPGNVEIADVCEGKTFQVPASGGWVYTAQGFAVLEWVCWTPNGDLPIPPSLIPGNAGV